MFDAIRKSVQLLAALSDEQAEIFIGRLQTIHLIRDQLLIKEGQVCQTAYFINRGSLRHFNVKDDGTEATLSLFIQHDWVMEHKSFVSQQPSQNIIQATEDVELSGISIHEIHALTKISERFFRLGRVMDVMTSHREFQSIGISPEEKYEKLLASRPELLHYFPLKHIASYLGMTPETLSRVRKKACL